MGHATRCVPLIKQLQESNKVIIGITPTTATIFNEEFPELQKVIIEPYNITYSKFLPISIKLLFDSLRILNVIKKEHQQLHQIVKEYEINVVISDNRFGLYHKNVESIYITHQLNIQADVFSGIANKIHHYYIKKFNHLWVPDFKNASEALAGDLSKHKKFANALYIGILSRLKIPQTVTTKVYDYLFLISGPEPQRTEFELRLLELSNNTTKKIALVRGNQMLSLTNTPTHISVYNAPTAKELSELITSSHTIICRSGYSTLMDLYTLKNTNCILVPTPSQTEQVYLADFWRQKFNCKIIPEHKLRSLTL